MVYIAKDPKYNAANTTKSDVYYIPLKTFKETKTAAKVVTTKGLEGASSGVVFSPSGSSLIFVRQKGLTYESDKWRLIHVPDVRKSLVADEFYKSADGLGSWDRSASEVFWSVDGKTKG